MMRSLFSGVSGLKGHQTRMDVIGNNIANVNTTGFKSSRATFADMISQTLSGASTPDDNIGGTNPKQVGLGAAVSSIDMIFTDGSVQSTGKNTDLCLSGNGLFVVNRGSETFYTRNGAFEFDSEGNYVLPGSGLKVQGWIGSDGVINTSGAVTDITIPAGKSMAAEATSIVTYANNLNSAEPTITSVSGGTVNATSPMDISLTVNSEVMTGTFTGSYDSSMTYKVGSISGTALTLAAYDSSGNAQTAYDLTVNLTAAPSATPTVGDAATITSLGSSTASTANPVIVTLSDGTTLTETSGTYTTGYTLPLTTTVTVYDSLGNSHSIPVYFTKTLTDSTNGNQWTVSVNTDGSGTVDIPESDGSTTTVTMADAVIQFTTDGKYSSGSDTITLTLANGATTGQTITVTLSDLTQYAGNNTINGSADGNAAGTLSSIAIDSSGIITGTYTNGVKQAEAQVAIAQFTNASGLTKTGNSLYQESNNSGTANIKRASDLGVTITGSALEMSNVDVANEFSDMIITQRGFQSNSKIITVSDELLETVINMKR